MKIACEQAKIDLSDAGEYSITLESISQDKDFEYNLSRAEFDEICAPLYAKIVPLIEGACKGAEIMKENIDEIVLVGGTSRIPKVQEMLKAHFDKVLNVRVNPDEAVALGATVLAASLTG